MRNISKRFIAIFICFSMVLATTQSYVMAVETKDINNLLVVLPGTVQAALGGGDWNPADTITKMESLGDGKYEFMGGFHKGSYEYKVAIGGNWNENYGKNGMPGGDNFSLVVPENNYQVRFIFDYKNKQLKDSINNPTEVKPYRVPKEIKVIGLGNVNSVMQSTENDIYKLTVKLPKGGYEYKVQYDGSDKFIYGAKGIRNGEFIKLNLDTDSEVTLNHNLSTNVTYDSVNYIPVNNNEIPAIECEGLESVAMEDNDKDNVFEGSMILPKGSKTYNFSVKMGEKTVGTKIINFNELVDNFKINFKYDNKSKTFTNDYSEKLTLNDNKVEGRSLYYDSRDSYYKNPFGAVVQGTNVTFRLTAKANDLTAARFVVQTQKIEGNQDSVTYSDTIKYPMNKVGLNDNGTREIWEVTVPFKTISVFGYYFEAIDGTSMVIYGNNQQVVPVPHTRVIGTGGIGQFYDVDDNKLVKYTQTVFDKDFKTPDWSKDAIYYYIFPDRFKNGDKSNDEKPGTRKFYGDKDVEFHSNWTDKPWIPGDGDGSTTDDNEWCNDFFGGDLAGVMEKLDYLKDLGINTIYLNPIFFGISNHKYDTADYMKIDSGFGTNELFKQLTAKAKEKGMRIILDASLNHSSADSIYMDRYGKYATSGAFENEKINKNSSYYDWYEFNEKWDKPDNAYNQWGNPTLANLKESDSYKDFAFRNKDSVMKYWLDQGASGWRMDVAPWVSDEFWKEWRKEIKQKDPDAMTICETWFDSSKYFLGNQFDSTMNYIFRQAVIDYANGQTGQNTVNVLEMMRENYPEEAFYSLMNLLSTHDAERTLNAFGYKGEGDSPETIKLAKQKLLLSTFIQMTYPGAPTIYYGDEVGVTGADDPFNRGTYPWKEDGGKPDENLLNEYKKLLKLRNENEVLRRGSVKTLYGDDNVIVLLRQYKDKNAIVAINNSDKEKTVSIKVGDLKVDGADINNGVLTIKVPALYGTVLGLKTGSSVNNNETNGKDPISNGESNGKDHINNDGNSSSEVTSSIAVTSNPVTTISSDKSGSTSINLPKTGSVFDFKVLIVIGMLLTIGGTVFIRLELEHKKARIK